jgi:hypothetical protein
MAIITGYNVTSMDDTNDSWFGTHTFIISSPTLTLVFRAFNILFRALDLVTRTLRLRLNPHANTPEAVKMNEINPKYDNTRKIHRLLTNQNPGFLYKV